LCIASSLGFQAGNYLLAIGGTANFAGTTAVKFTDPVNGDWTTLEHLNCRSAPGAVTDGLDVIFAYIPSAAGQATVTNFDGTSPGWTTNQWSTAGATCTEYGTGAGGTVTSNTGNVLNFSGGQTPTVGNPIVVGGFVKFVNTSPGEDYTAATIVEVTGASGLIGHVANQNAFTSGATLSTGTIAPWSGAGAAISFGLDDNNDSAGPYNPLAGSGNTDDGVLWKWNISTAILRMQDAAVTSPGSAYGMNFTTQCADHHMAFLAVLRIGASGTSTPGPVPRQLYIMP
jgi:hypothetical protein